jgi:predicted aspartyl protease
MRRRTGTVARMGEFRLREARRQVAQRRLPADPDRAVRRGLRVAAVAIVAGLSLAWLSRPRAPQEGASVRLAKDAHARMVTDVRINGDGPFGFVVDTGAAMSTISAPLAARLGLPTVPLVRVTVQGTAGEQQASMYLARSYVSGLFARRLEPLVELPNSSIVGDGVIGMNAFKTSVLAFDFASLTLTIGDAGVAFRGAEVLRATLQGTDVIVPITVDGVPAAAMVDTGARRTIANLALVHALGLDVDTLAVTEPAEGATTDRLPAHLMTRRSLRLGRVAVSAPTMVVAELQYFKRHALADTPAVLLGIDVLSGLHLLAIDYPRSEVRLKP